MPDLNSVNNTDGGGVNLITIKMNQYHLYDQIIEIQIVEMFLTTCIL